MNNLFTTESPASKLGIRNYIYKAQFVVLNQNPSFCIFSIPTQEIYYKIGDEIEVIRESIVNQISQESQN